LRALKRKRASATNALKPLEKYYGALMAVTATATIAATAFAFKIRFGRHAAELEGFADELIDGLMNVVHFLLRFEETARDGIGQDGFAFLFESGDFLAAQLLGALLFLLERLAFGHESLVLSAGFFVGNKSLDSLASGTHLGLVQNGLAEFPGLVGD
jgi:hypothetical protein